MAFTLPAEGDVATPEALRRPTHALFDHVRQQLRRCKDIDVTFVPQDPHADDPGAGPGSEASAAWTLGHVIAHLTASAEESAVLAAELARGVPHHGRSRREVPWQEFATVAQCRARLEESRRICVASLSMWPDRPDLANTYVPWDGAAPMGAIARYLLGLSHAAGHVEQVRDIVAQAHADRRARTLLGRWRNRLRGREGRRPDRSPDQPDQLDERGQFTLDPEAQRVTR